MLIVDVGNDFHHRLTNRDESQGDGRHTAVQFRTQYLLKLDNQEAWDGRPQPHIALDFRNVDIIAPSFANEAFAHFTQYAERKEILTRIQLIHISEVKKQIIEIEIDAGRSR